MKFKYFLASIIFLSLIQACGNKNIAYKKIGDKDSTSIPSKSQIVRSFYLLGDAGEGKSKNTLSTLKGLKNFLDSVPGNNENFVLFLGDNVKAEALAGDDPKAKADSEAILDQQIAVVKDENVTPIFLPGEKDWDRKGLAGLKNESEYLEKKLDRDAFMPDCGCPLQFVDISDKVHLIILDSQWFITNWDKHTTVSDDCPETKTRDAMFVEVETELKKNQNKTTIVVLHHPLYSNGVHGGNFYLTPFLNPSGKKIPVPVIGSFANLLRTSGGLSSQDKLNKRYKQLVSRLETISTKWGKVVFASGHDHSLQYIEHDPVKQIISGSVAISSRAGLRNDGFFASNENGFAVFDVFQDGSSRVSFYGTEGKKPVLLFQKEVFGPDKEFSVEKLQRHFQDSITTSVYPDQKQEIEDFIGDFWGKGYRKIYTTDVKVPMIELDTLYGGLEPMRMGGGHQTSSLRVKDSLNREYNFRKLKKDPLQYIQATLYKNEPVSDLFEGSILEHLINGFYTASHPYGFLAVPTLADAAGVYHTNPDLFYLPKQPQLEKYNFDHGNALYMIEERPEEHWLEHESFGAPNHDIQSTEGLFNRLRRDEKYSLDESSYVRARIFDMFLGDWDRHNDQWRWSEFDKENDDHVFQPIPRDRDQVFSNFDGTFFKILRATLGLAKRFAVYDEDISNLEEYSDPAITLDRALLQRADRNVWISQAKELQRKLSDDKIEEAFRKLPKEIQGEQTGELVEKAKARRDNLVDLAEEYYDYLSNTITLKGTDKDDFFDITRLEEGNTRVVIARNKDGERKDTIIDRTFFPEETKELIIYGLDDDDQFYVKGDGNSPIMVRLIGGQDEDLYSIKNKNHLKIYDHRSQGSIVEQLNGASKLFTDDFYVNFYNPNRKDPDKLSVAPDIGYNPDDGVVIGIKAEQRVGNLVEYPWNTRHSFGVRYFSRTRGFDLNYLGEIKDFNKPYDYFIRLYYSSPNHTRNFFGWGNETENLKDDPWGFNRIRLEHIKGQLGLIRNSKYGHHLEIGLVAESFKIMMKGNPFLDNYSTYISFFDHQFFGGIEGAYSYENYDSALAPTSGLKIDLSAGWKTNFDSRESYAFFSPSMDLYNAISRNRKLVLHTKFRSQLNYGDFPFYLAPSIGGSYGLRGFRQERFIGDQALAVGGDLLYHFDTFSTSFLPLQPSIYGGYDVGRVWWDEQESRRWHTSYGGGLHVNIEKILGTKFALFKSKEGWRFRFGLGLSF